VARPLLYRVYAGSDSRRQAKAEALAEASSIGLPRWRGDSSILRAVAIPDRRSGVAKDRVGELVTV